MLTKSKNTYLAEEYIGVECRTDYGKIISIQLTVFLNV